MRGLVHVRRYRQALILRDQGLSYAAMAEQIGLAHPLKAWTLHRTALKWLQELTGPPEAPPPRVTPSPELVAWAAGFFDGEGCVYGYEDVQRGYRRFTFGVQVAQVKRAPLELLEANWGGSIRSHKKQLPQHQDQWVWAIRGRAAAEFLTDLLPHLQVKDDAVRAAIPCLGRVHRPGDAYTDEEVLGRRAAVAILKSLNRRGKEVAPSHP